MAAKKKVSRKVSYVLFHKFAAAVSLLAFVVMIISGLMAEARLTTITYRALIAMLVVGLVSRVVIRVVATYEEMNSGQG
jgi:hypothetical protein